MPELPEVESLARFLDSRLRDRTVERALPASFAAVKTFDPPLSALEGLRFDACSRRGKFLVLSAPPLHLVIHLARAGWIRWRAQLEEAIPKPGRGPLALRIRLDGGDGLDVTEQGTEKRLAVYVVRELVDVPGIAALGIDALDTALDPAALGVLLAGRRDHLKGVLSDQSVLAGIGNAYSDEILHAARLSPYKPAGGLSGAELDRLHTAMREVLGAAVTRSTDLAAQDLKAEKRSGLQVHGRAGEACPVCGAVIREVSLSGRSFQYCPTCQTGGRVLADRRMSRLLR